MLVSGEPKAKQALSPLLKKVKKGGCLADPRISLLFCSDSQSPFLCPVSGHCILKRQGGMGVLLGTLGKFLISLASIFL